MLYVLFFVNFFLAFKIFTPVIFLSEFKFPQVRSLLPDAYLFVYGLTIQLILFSIFHSHFGLI